MRGWYRIPPRAAASQPTQRSKKGAREGEGKRRHDSIRCALACHVRIVSCHLIVSCPPPCVSVCSLASRVSSVSRVSQTVQSWQASTAPTHRQSITSTWLPFAPWCRGVSPSWSASLGLAPALSRVRTIPIYLALRDTARAWVRLFSPPEASRQVVSLGGGERVRSLVQVTREARRRRWATSAREE